jgi:hypothetical protein
VVAARHADRESGFAMALGAPAEVTRFAGREFRHSNDWRNGVDD